MLNRCIFQCTSRISHSSHITISSIRCTYSTLTQQHTASAELIANDDVLFNKHLSDWSINDVTLWLSRIDNGSYSNYIHCFEDQKIDGLTLQYLSENDLSDLGVHIMGDRKHIIHCLNDLFRYYNMNINILTSHSHQSVNDERITIDITTDRNDTTNTHNIVPSAPLPENIETNDTVSDTKQHMLKLFHPDFLPPMIELPQFDNQQSNISSNMLRVEYVCPWSIDKFNTDFNAQISHLFLSYPEVQTSASMDAICSTFNCDIDHENDQLILHGNFIELSTFIKRVHKLDDCPTLPLLPRISHFLLDCGELQRISKMLSVIPFIKNDGKLAFYSLTNPIYATEAIDAVKSLLKTLDCSSWFGALHTSIIGTLLSMNNTKAWFTTNLARYGYIQYWNRGHSLFESEYKLSYNIQRDKIYHLLLMKSFSPSNLNKMKQIVTDLLNQHSSCRVTNIGLVSFILYQHKSKYFKDLQQEHSVFIGACPHSKTAYVCGATDKIRQQVLDEICERSMYSKLSYCKLSETFQDYVVHCHSLSHFRALKKLHNKQMNAQFLYNDHDKQTYLATPSIYEADCNDFIQNVLEPSLLTLKTNKDSQTVHEYMTLMSKISSKQQFLTPHITLDESKDNLYIFHKRLTEKKQRWFIKKEIIRYQNMKHHAMNVSKIYPWLRKFMHNMLKNAIHWDSSSALITLLEDDYTLNIRCTDRIFDKLQRRFTQIRHRIFTVPIHERLHWIQHYEMNNNVNVLNDKDFLICVQDGVYYIYNRNYYETIAWINRYLEILLQIGLTYNQFPNDEYILQRDCEFLLQILPKFNHLPDKKALFVNQSIVNFTLLMIYQCVLSTRYDLLLSIWRVLNELKMEDNILIPNFLHTVFVVGAQEFCISNMKELLVKSGILFEAEMIKFIFKTLKEYQKKEELQLMKDVLEDIHLDNDIKWTFDKINWSL